MVTMLKEHEVERYVGLWLIAGRNGGLVIDKLGKREAHVLRMHAYQAAAQRKVRSSEVELRAICERMVIKPVRRCPGDNLWRVEWGDRAVGPAQARITSLLVAAGLESGVQESDDQILERARLTLKRISGG